jgi:DNA mismatch repair ATPase MutS
MKAFLMHREQDFDLAHELPRNAGDLVQDLELTTLFNAMARGDEFLFDIAKRAVLSSIQDLDAIRYRQDILADCLRQPAVVRDLYNLAVEAIQGEKKVWLGAFSKSPDLILHRGVEVLEMFVGMLKRLRGIADEYGPTFQSDGFIRFFQMLIKELSDEYLSTVEHHLRQLQFRGGVLESAELGPGNKATNYVLRKPTRKESWLDWISGNRPPSYTYHIPERDESGAQALRELRERGINLVANALAQSNDHILSFFTMLRSELAFYVGCANLHERLTQKGEPTCLPDPLPADQRRLTFRGLYDVSLSLNMGDRRVVGNDVDAHGVRLLMITGANQGGKSTFLRSLGLSYLMMQCGMFVPAQSLQGNVYARLFTHFKREEDATMRSGKLDEELSRMNNIADQLIPNSIVLFNESFASTNEREGSQIAREIIRALQEKQVTVVFVTHLFDLAHSLHTKKMDDALFLRAERQADGRRTFKLVPGNPLPTSFGEDLYRRIFGGELQSIGSRDTGGPT